MRATVLAVVASVSLALAALAAPAKTAPPQSAAPQPQQLTGWALYDRYCLACHGARGDGNGPAAPFAWGTPRDFTSGAYAWRSTAVGEPPTDDDLRAAIRFGVAGTSMPRFDQILSDTELDQLIDVLEAFAPQAFASAKRSKVITLGAAPATTDPERGAKLWTQQGCDTCHGATGRGDGPAVGKNGVVQPYDLTRAPLRRPHGPDVDKRRAIAMSLATGLTGTGMPGYAGTVTDADLWALADHVAALSARAARTDRSALDQDTITRDEKARLPLGLTIAPQGPAPSTLAPAEASLSARQCARCHAKQAREWTGSVHAAASTWGLPARELDHAAGEGTSCNRCHTPLAEQSPTDPAFDANLRAEGVQCAGCHVRNWTRQGPPNRAPSLLPASGYPKLELADYERSDFCLPCHQLPPRTAVAGKPLLNTYKEWLEGPYMARGIQCQHCHMPNREHTWLGIHDADTVRQGIRLGAEAHGTSTITVVATLTNIGAGHYLPTTATPALWLRIELVDKTGAVIAGARAERRIGRDIAYTSTGWVEREDTRIPPGETVTVARAWTGGRTAEAAFARITVEVHPDAYYEGLYTERLATKLPTATADAYRASLTRAQSAHYVAAQQTVSIRR